MSPSTIRFGSLEPRHFFYCSSISLTIKLPISTNISTICHPFAFTITHSMITRAKKGIFKPKA